MASELNITEIREALRKYPEAELSIGTDSVIRDTSTIYNISVVLRFNGDKACVIWNKDIVDKIVSDQQRRVNELALLCQTYTEIGHLANLSVDIHKKWFNRNRSDDQSYRLNIYGIENN